MPRPRLDTSALPALPGLVGGHQSPLSGLAGLFPGLLGVVSQREPTAYLANVDSLWVLCDERGTPESLRAPIVAEPDSRFAYYGFVSKEAAEAYRVMVGASETFKPVEFRKVTT